MGRDYLNYLDHHRIYLFNFYLQYNFCAKVERQYSELIL